MADRVRHGARFEHVRLIVGSPKAGTARPDVCTITAVRGGMVWYRNESGMPFKIAEELVQGIVKRWIEEESRG